MSARWKATAYYRSCAGSVDVDWLLEELEDLHDFVEAGPHWDMIEKIVVVRVNHVEGRALTIEEAGQL